MSVAEKIIILEFMVVKKKFPFQDSNFSFFLCSMVSLVKYMFRSHTTCMREYKKMINMSSKPTDVKL